MADNQERFDFHVRIEDERLEGLDAIVREFQPYVVRLGPALPAGKPFQLDLLVSAGMRDRLERAGHKVQEIARVYQAQDLKRQVSQTDRFAEELARLKRRGE